jgi:murein DD-endopeptidase MepM/ murein hydrolase activator NlpD/flagellum-specific peptidoglycan hydrolase FlgJ
MGKAGKWLGIGGKGEKALEGAEGATKAAGKRGWFSRWFRGGKAVEGAEGATKALGGVGDAAKGAEGLEGATKVAKGVAGAAEEGGMFAKILGKMGGVGKVLGKLGGFGKLLGKLALPLTIIMGVIDFIGAFINAEEFLGSKKKLDTLDRVGAGLGGVIKGLVGIVDFVLGLFGIKTDLGGILGKAAAKTFAAVFHAIAAIFKVIMKIAEPVFKILGPILNFIATRLAKMLEIIAEFFEGFANFLEGLADIIGAVFSDDPEKTLKEGISKLTDGIIGMLKGLGKFILHMLGMDMLIDAFTNVKKSFTEALDQVAQAIKDFFSIDQFKGLTDVLAKIRDFIMAPINWLAEKLGLKVPDTKKKEEVKGPAAPKAPGLPKGYNPKTGQIDPETPGQYKSRTTPTQRTGNYDEQGTGQQPTPPSTTPERTPAPTPPPAQPPPTAPQPVEQGDAKAIPVSGSVTSLFGRRNNALGGVGTEGHGAVDIGTPVGTPVYAADGGKVLRANGTDDPNGYGNFVEIAHKDGYVTRYGHLSAFDVSPGDTVKKGDPIGKSGGAKGAPGSGRSSGPHLHFEVRKNGQKVDPQMFLGMTLQKGGRLDGGSLAKGNAPTEVQDQNDTKVAKATDPNQQPQPRQAAVVNQGRPSIVSGESALRAGISIRKANEIVPRNSREAEGRPGFVGAPMMGNRPGQVPPEIAEMAKQAEAETGVPAQVQIAQWALESGWGKKSIGNNVFGMTATNRHQKRQTVNTTEDMTMQEFARLSKQEQATAREINGGEFQSNWEGKKKFRVNREFADYDSIKDSFKDHARLLADPKGPYAGAMAEYRKTGDINKYIESISPTYASDRNYGSTVKQIANQNSVVSALNRPGRMPEQEPVQLASLNGVRLTQAAVDAGNLQRSNFMGRGDTPSNVVVAPQSNTIQQSTHIADLTAKNTDSSYQRLMNSQFVST